MTAPDHPVANSPNPQQKAWIHGLLWFRLIKFLKQKFDEF